MYGSKSHWTGEGNVPARYCKLCGSNAHLSNLCPGNVGINIARLTKDSEEIAFMCAESDINDVSFSNEEKSGQKMVKTTMPAERKISLAPIRLDELTYEVKLPDGTIMTLSLNALDTVEQIQKLLWAKETYKHPQSY